MKRLSYASLFAVGLLYAACQNPMDKVDLGFKTELQPAVELQFTPQGGSVPADMQVQLTGPDADKVVNTLNTKNFRIDDAGVLKLSVPSKLTLSASQPLRFTVVAKAAGYLDVVQPLEVTSQSTRTVAVPLLSERSAQPIATAAAQSSAGTLSQSLEVKTPEQQGIQSSATLTAGTKLVDKQGEALEGELTFTMNSLLDDPQTGDVELPEGGILDPNARVAADKDKMKLTNVVAVANLSAYDKKYRLAFEASQSVKLSMAVRPKAMNLEANRAIQVGDRVPMYRYDRASGKWSEEKPGVVQKAKSGNRLELVAEVFKFGFYVAGFQSKTCKEEAVFKIKSNFKDYDKKFLCRLSYVGKNGKDSAVAAVLYQTLNNDEELRVKDLLINTSVRMKVYENPLDEKSAVESEVISACGGKPGTVDVRSFKRNGDLMAFVVEFPCSNVNDKKLPESVTAQYREVGTKEWKNLVTLYRKDINGGRMKGISYLLSKNQRYDFRVKLLTYTFEQPDYLLDKELYIIKINTQEFCK
ncbi:hypothetical protein [Tellurirhabdus rosea]|uniref:hypothetical protein n=1 Tax=Tellurirhabdus rosea TaxID=2674997 RepID=UPI00225431DC|nr:hypothetical protein [Tellurirhabdus rosea]